jgi:DNA-directed RNA polymerase subunit RPC12/RpoP
MYKCIECKRISDIGDFISDTEFLCIDCIQKDDEEIINDFDEDC